MSAALPMPVIDFGGPRPSPLQRSASATAVQRALTHNGFMYAVGLGIEAAVVQRAFGVMRRFFGEARELKDRYAYGDIDANFGYQGMGLERLDPGGTLDLKESFTMRNAPQLADQRQRWPDERFRDAALALYVAGIDAAFRILRAIASCLALPDDYFALRHRGENVTLRFLHYPAGMAVGSAAQLGAGAHTDYGSITLLFQDDVGGLELLNAGEWLPAPPLPGAAVINTGDLMERWTNGRFRSTVHRVRPVGGNRDRYSIALFVDPDTAVEIECVASCVSDERPLRYPRITAGEHIRQKIAATHGGIK
jgi:isopenicillin N synthase-like dioxygenase